MSGAIYPSLKDTVVLVTGGGTGIGESIVEHFAEQGSKVAFLDIAEEPSRALQQRLRDEGHTVTFIPCDLTDIAALQASIATVGEDLGPITVLVNNAAHDERHSIEDLTPEYFEQRISVNLRHQVFAIQAVLPFMKAEGGGSIINMGSVSWMLGAKDMPVYTASKAAVLGLTRGLARELGEHNVRVNSVAPGWILTQRQLDLWMTPDAHEHLMKSQALKRELKPADIARWVLFLAADDSSAATNQSYVVDGGWL